MKIQSICQCMVLLINSDENLIYKIYCIDYFIKFDWFQQACLLLILGHFLGYHVIKLLYMKAWHVIDDLKCKYFLVNVLPNSGLAKTTI